MHPYYTIFGHELPTYGLMAVIGGLAGFLPVFFLARLKKLNLENMIYLYALSIAGAIVGAKFVYLINMIPVYVETLPQAMASDMQTVLVPYLKQYVIGGMSLAGGMAGAAVSFAHWAKAFRVNRAAYASVMGIAVPLALSFVRLGCTAAGCCYGAETARSFHIVFHHSPVAPNGVPLIPTQPMEAAFHLLWFLVLLIRVLLDKGSERDLYSYAIGYGIYRFFTDFVRGDRLPVFYLPGIPIFLQDGISPAQYTAFLLAIAALILRIKTRRETPQRQGATDQGNL